MVGSPKKRARKAEAELAALQERYPEIMGEAIDDEPRPKPKTATTTTAPRSVTTGPRTRHAVDTAVSDEVTRLSEQLAPGLTARIYRTRPSWAAGWIEDVPLDSGKVADLLEYIAAEHGGSLYKVTLIAPDGRAYFDTSIPIAEPTKRRGKIITRDQDESGQQPAQKQTPTNDSQAMQFLALLLENSRRAEERSARLLQEIVEASNRKTEEFLAIIKAQSGPSPKSLVSELQSFIETKEAIGDAITILTPEKPNPETEPEKAGIDAALSGAAKDFFTSVLLSKVGIPPAQPAQPKPTTPANGRSLQIPDAEE